MTWILWVLILADGTWRAWEREYATLDQCQEVQRIITLHREDRIRAECRVKE